MSTHKSPTFAHTLKNNSTMVSSINMELQRHRRFSKTCALMALIFSQNASGFTPLSNSHPSHRPLSVPSARAPPPSSTALNVWWFGGTPEGSSNDDESCELVAVRIQRTSPNSRRIAGDITVSKSMDDVWAILTDYDNLAVHVPNLVESRRVNPSFSATGTGVQGDGSYKCRLFQKGAQKIVGFEFGASVTMDMTESMMTTNTVSPRMLRAAAEQNIQVGEQRRISFKCVESQFFSEFDGDWIVTWTDDPDDPTKLATKLQYEVEVRPKGPVPVSALEWRIREDVPTNLRAVKAASMELGRDGVLALRDGLRKSRDGTVNSSSTLATRRNNSLEQQDSKSNANAIPTSGRRTGSGRTRRSGSATSSVRQNVRQLVNNATAASKSMASASATQKNMKLSPVRVQWYEDETMGAYLKKRK
jgi:hypothetical protein